MALGEVCALGGQIPAQLSGPVLGHSSEMVQNDAQAQGAVDGGVVCVGGADQGDPAGLQQEAVGLPVQVAGGQGGGVEGFPEHIVIEADGIIQAIPAAPGALMDQIADAALGLKVVALGGDVDVGHTLDVQPQAAGGLHAVAKGGDGGDLQRGVDAQGVLDLLTVGEGHPAAIQPQVRELQDQILHDEAGIQMGVGMTLRQQHQILGRTHQEIVIAGSALQGIPCVGAEEVQLGPDLGDQTADGSTVVILHLLQGLEGDDLVLKGPDGFSVLDQCGVIHIDTS